MARKEPADSPSARGFNDIIGIVLLCLAVLLLTALLSYHPRDVSANSLPTNPAVHNWIGPFGAWMAYYWLFWVGLAAFVAPILLLVIGLGCFFDAFSYLRRRWAWTLALFICCIGLLDLYRGYLTNIETHFRITAGGILGMNLNRRVFGYFGTAGATILFLMIYFISLLYLTNFKLGDWIRSLMARRAERLTGATPAEQALERKKRELQKEARKLEEQMETSSSSGLGADMKPVPAPNVVDLSVPQSKPGRQKKPSSPEPQPEDGPAEVVEVIKAQEVRAATSADILGKSKASPEPSEKADASTEGAVAEVQDSPTETPLPAPPVAPAAPSGRSKYMPRKPKPITVASTPMIGNYQLPSIDFLQLPDTTLKPTESKEELMANARLMQQTLAQFDIEVSLGDITKGPTITRYELHPAPA